MSESNSELEAFRQKWREEVSAKAQGSAKLSTQGTSKGLRQSSHIPVIPTNKLSKSRDNDDEGPQTISSSSARRLSDGEIVESSNSRSAEPQSALEHYEKAVERENEGSLGDSLNLYRKAFRVRYEVLSLVA
jgi:F-box protein 9